MKKYLFLCLTCWSISSWGAFAEPVEAQKDSRRFIEKNPNFPIENVGIIFSIPTDPKVREKTPCQIATAILLNEEFALTAYHTEGLSSTATITFFNNHMGSYSYNAQGTANSEYIIQHPFSREVVKIYAFSKTVDSLQSSPEYIQKASTPLHGKDKSMIENIRDQLSIGPEFQILMNNIPTPLRYDVVLLKLGSKVNGVQPITLNPTCNIEEAVGAVVGIITKWHFATGESSFDGKVPPQALLQSPTLVAPSFLSPYEGKPHNTLHKQVLFQHCRRILGKPKAFSMFIQSIDKNDESVDLSTSRSYHAAVPPEHASLIGPFVGGFSGGPVFLYDDRTSAWNLFGTVSQTLMSYMPLEKQYATLNITQTLSEELISKIMRTMDKYASTPKTDTTN